jgi:hypothetical protein
VNDSERRQLAEFDRFHMRRGDYEEWMLSEERQHFAGNQKVRVVNYANIEEVCQKAGLNLEEVRRAHKEAVETGDIIFVTYEEADA